MEEFCLFFAFFYYFTMQILSLLNMLFSVTT